VFIDAGTTGVRGEGRGRIGNDGAAPTEKRARVAQVLQIAALVAALLAGLGPARPLQAQEAAVTVAGNRRVEADTIRSYFRPGPGGRLDAGRIDDALKALYATGLFADVRVDQSGGRVTVTVVENQVIGRVAFEGNKKIKDDQLQSEIQSKPRGTLSRPMVQADAQRISEIYRRSGRYDVRVVPQVIEQPNNRVDLVFEITEGSKTGIKTINFEGNSAYSAARLKDVIKTRESNLLSFLASGDLYDPDRIEADRDLIRRFYLKNGYADVQVVAALTEYDPAGKGFIVTFRIEEGQQYRVGSVDFRSTIATFNAQSLASLSRVAVGAVYNAEAVEKSIEEMQIEASRRGFAFAMVRPSGDRNFAARTVAIVFTIDEGPRTYIERINIRGNTRTRDYVIRREFDLSEGDAYNRALVDRAERRLKNLDYFKSVKITPEPGSSSDRVVLNVDLEEKSTGEFSVSGGYSTTDGFLGEVSVAERNLLGTGLYAKASVSYGQYTKGFSLSMVEPYLLGYRVALGTDIFYNKQDQNSYRSYSIESYGFNTRLGFQLREDLTLQLRYSLSAQQIGLTAAYNNCNNNAAYTAIAYNPTPGCYSDGEASLPVRIELDRGMAITSAIGYTLTFNTLDNNKNPTAGLLVDLRQDFAGLGGNVSYVKTTGDLRYYQPLVADLVGLIHLQGGILNKSGKDELRMLDHFQMGPQLVRGFASNGIGPRDITSGTAQDALGGTRYWGASAEVQMPFWFLPKEVGLKGSVYADAGSLWGYQGPTSWAKTLETMDYSDSATVRSSVGVGLIWASPFGPLRFDYAVPLTKGKYDNVQQFRFGGGTSF
jgi:outer membrane protein insertion porin family